MEEDVKKSLEVCSGFRIEGEIGIEQGQEQSSDTIFDARLSWTKNLMQGHHELMRLVAR